MKPFAVRSQSPEAERKDTLVGDLAAPYGLWPVRVEAVGLVFGLDGTGSDPVPDAMRARLLGELQTRGVRGPTNLLASPSTSLVVIRGVIPPGIQEGDHFDLEVRTSSRSETTSLRAGYLLQTPLTEMAVLNQQFHEGHRLALASGPVMVDPMTQEESDVNLCRGRILGGGVALKSRPIGLALREGHQNCSNSSRLEATVNRRFNTIIRGQKVGMAKAKTDKFIQLDVHPRYKDNVQRYAMVIQALAIDDSTRTRTRRLQELTEKLHDPKTSAGAALQLEAIGKEGIEPLKMALNSGKTEVRFYAAEALAYLDDVDAVDTLIHIVKTEPAFRVFALTALSAMDHPEAYHQLCALLHSPSAETRYGAFRSLWAMNPHDPVVLGEVMGKDANRFSFHVLNAQGPPMLHVTRSKRPELVMFGNDQRFIRPLALRAGKIMVTTPPDQRGASNGTIAVAKYEVGQAGERRIVPNRIESVIRAIVELGGTYPDIVQMLGEADAAGALPGRFAVDALPEAGRVYTPGQQLADAPPILQLPDDAAPDAQPSTDQAPGAQAVEDREVASPRGELFSASGPQRGNSMIQYGPTLAPLPPREQKKKTWLGGLTSLGRGS